MPKSETRRCRRIVTLNVVDGDAERSAAICASTVAWPCPWRQRRLATKMPPRRHAHRRVLERAEPGAFDIVGEPDADVAALRRAAFWRPASKPAASSASSARSSWHAGSRRCHRPRRCRAICGGGDRASARAPRNCAAAPRPVEPSSRATRSSSRSIAKTACGRPAPRTGVVGTLLVSTTRSAMRSRQAIGPGNRWPARWRHDHAEGA